MNRSISAVMLACCLPAACAQSGNTLERVTSSAPAATATTSSSPSTATRTGDAGDVSSAYEVVSLGLTFSLSESFYAADDPDYLFFALSLRPQSLFTIAPEPSSVTDHQARPGETLERIEIDGVDGVVVRNAALDGLPSDARSHELLVSNRDRSFSVIMSGQSASLDELWAVFIDSVRIS